MPESPLLHLSWRYCLFLRSLLDRQTSGPKRYDCVAAVVVDAGTVVDCKSQSGVIVTAPDVDLPFKWDRVFFSFCKTLPDVCGLSAIRTLPLLFELWLAPFNGIFCCRFCLVVSFVVVDVTSSFVVADGFCMVSMGFSVNDGLETALIWLD